jgi:hypothetical protein
MLAGLLATGLATTTPAAAATVDGSAGTQDVTIGHVCAALADYIQFLESRPPSPLRDFLLEQAQVLFARFC